MGAHFVDLIIKADDQRVSRCLGEQEVKFAVELGEFIPVVFALNELF